MSKSEDYVFLAGSGPALTVRFFGGRFIVEREVCFEKLFRGHHADLRTVEGMTVGEMQRSKLHEMLDDWINRELGIREEATDEKEKVQP